MELKLEVYTPALELVGVLEIQRSVIWAEKAFSAGSFSLESIIAEESRALLVPENILWIAGDTAGIIEHVEQQAGAEGPYITVKGRDLTGLLDRRILWGQYDLSGTPAAIMHKLVEDSAIAPTRGDVKARKLPGLVSLAAPVGGQSIRVQKTGGTLLEALEQLGETYQVAFGVRFNAAVPCMEFWTRPGADRSVDQNANEPVFYSTELDDVMESEYSYDSSKYRNVSLVAGEGEGGQRVMVTVETAVEPEPQPPIPPEPGKTYAITLAVDPEGGGVASGGGTVSEGDSVTVTATPAEGYVFSGWREGTEIVSTQAIYTFQASADRSLTAVFAAIIPTYTISVSVGADQEDWGTVTGGGQYQEGSSVTVTATPNEGYQFTAWQENGKQVSTDATYTFQVSGDRALVAVFAVKKVSRLPEGYTELEYIKSDNKCSVKTSQVAHFQNRRVVIDIEPDGFSGNTESIVSAPMNSGYNTYFYLHRAGTTTIKYRYAKSNIVTKTIDITNKRIVVDWDFTKGTLSIGNEKYTTTKSTAIIATSISIFGSASSASYSIAGKLYSAQFYYNGDIKLDFVPCINPSGTVGLYDLVNGEFYGNAGTGTFTAGPAV